MIASHLSGGNFSIGRDELDAGIVDEDVGRPELGRATGDHRLDRRGVADVGAVVTGAEAHSHSSLDFGRVAEAVEHYLRALAASARAMARPMPEVDPVTRAILPSSLMAALL